MAIELIIPDNLACDVIDNTRYTNYGGFFKQGRCFLPEVDIWIEDNICEKLQLRIDYKWKPALYDETTPYHFVITFGTERDAVLFKMRWL
jgi:hypothetical protein